MKAKYQIVSQVFETYGCHLRRVCPALYKDKKRRNFKKRRI